MTFDMFQVQATDADLCAPNNQLDYLIVDNGGSATTYFLIATTTNDTGKYGNLKVRFLAIKNYKTQLVELKT